ncbi:hypothetical protein [Spirulina sp. 06S082]|uniref:hypothetical protein n=1 Tax=Spirulina sp. 06S082 TaxID=3110248 RepID=UPI002B1FBDFB|nr:hypothetical protein [Spirulina sp. 06S082]MEA5471028.1 hypothetical protein [Spirulina sp. 06S082]
MFPPCAQFYLDKKKSSAIAIVFRCDAIAIPQFANIIDRLLHRTVGYHIAR